MASFGLQVLASNRKFYEGRCKSLVFPAFDGEMCILAHHENMVVSVIMGETRIQKEDGEWIKAVSGAGLVEIINNRVRMLVDTAELPDEIDKRRALEAKERIEEKLRQKQSIREYQHNKASLARALVRLKATDSYNI